MSLFHDRLKLVCNRPAMYVGNSDFYRATAYLFGYERRTKTDGGLVAAIRDSLKARLLQLAFLFAPSYPRWPLAQEVTVLTSFPGDSGPGPKDNPDNTGGVGPGHVVDCTDANIVIHDKKTGKVLRRMTQTEFWKAPSPASPAEVERSSHDV